MICNKSHKYLPDLRGLPDCQGGLLRHKCASCAYERGWDDGSEGKQNNPDLDFLNDSQAGTGRHKDAKAAYALGYYYGWRRRHPNG
jgi:hypothetical protein